MKWCFIFSFISIIGTLEKLKQEAAEITKKVEETDIVMAEVEAVTDQYRPLSQACSSIYFTMESLNLVSNFNKWFTTRKFIYADKNPIYNLDYCHWDQHNAQKNYWLKNVYCMDNTLLHGHYLIAWTLHYCMDITFRGGSRNYLMLVKIFVKTLL